MQDQPTATTRKRAPTTPATPAKSAKAVAPAAAAAARTTKSARAAVAAVPAPKPAKARTTKAAKAAAAHAHHDHADCGHDHSHDHASCGHDHSHDHNAVQPQRTQHIYVYSPSGAVADKAAFQRGLDHLRELGHAVEVDEDALARHTRFAGDDATRLAAIHRAAASGADVALISRGGYGLSRILPAIKYKAVAKAVAQGTKFVGMSDFTALQMALLAKTGATTWAGPTLGSFGTEGGPDDIMDACFDDLLGGHGEGTGWRMNAEKPNATTGKPAVPEIYLQNAPLWGGNLAMLTSLLGTPYFPEIQGGVLFLEDVAEHPYRVERMLTQLLHAGVLARQKAVVLGQFTNYQLAPNDKGYKLQTVVDWLRTQIKAPVLTNLPFGHVETKVLLPVGASVSLSVEGRDALIYWGHSH